MRFRHLTLAMTAALVTTAGLVTTVVSAGTESSKQIPERLYVIDSLGQIVGTLVSQDSVARKFKTIWVHIGSIQTAGFIPQDSTAFNFIHTSSNCSGPRYMDASALPVSGIVDRTNTLYMPGRPVQFLEPGSWSEETFTSGQPINQPGQCIVGTGAPGVYVGPLVTIDLNTLVPPFSVTSSSDDNPP